MQYTLRKTRVLNRVPEYWSAGLILPMFAGFTRLYAHFLCSSSDQSSLLNIMYNFNAFQLNSGLNTQMNGTPPEYHCGNSSMRSTEYGDSGRSA